MGVMWEIQTPGVPGALGVVQLTAPRGGMDAALTGLGMAPVGVGRVGVRDLLGVDRGVVVRWTEGSAWLMPHGGVAVVRGLVRELERRGAARAERADPLSAFPEAGDEVEARALAALARAASPLAVNVLLDQARRWRGRGGDVHGHAQSGLPMPPERARALMRLIDPPLVALAGRPNIGKSSLVNALAGRGVSVVADEAGTTRDHVGVMVDFAGVVVRLVDTPGVGFEGGEADREGEELARAVVGSADLVLRCGDAGAGPVELPGDSARLAAEDGVEAVARSVITVALRTDLGLPAWRHDVAVSVVTGEGVERLVALAREALVPAAALADERPWKFWD
ncbi:MAG: GTPase [Phycisphaerales bacterium]